MLASRDETTWEAVTKTRMQERSTAAVKAMDDTEQATEAPAKADPQFQRDFACSEESSWMQS